MPRPEYYKDNSGQWRWKITAGNHERTHASTEGFSSKAKARANFELLLDAALGVHQEVETTQPLNVSADSDQMIPGVDWDSLYVGVKDQK